MTTVGLLVAAGAGTRLAGTAGAGAGGAAGGSARPKALVQLAGRPLVVHAALALEASGAVDELVVVAGVDVVGEVEALLAAAGIRARVCAGGAERTDSVRHGLDVCPPGTGVVAVHDAARPLVSPELVARTVAALVDPWVAVAPGLPVVDTLKLLDPDRQAVLRTVDRRHVWAVQTPQVFAWRTLRAVHDSVSGGPVTDDLALVEQAGGRVRLIEGERRNLKITYPEDLHIAAVLLGGPR